MKLNYKYPTETEEMSTLYKNLLQKIEEANIRMPVKDINEIHSYINNPSELDNLIDEGVKNGVPAEKQLELSKSLINITIDLLSYKK